MSQAAPAPQRGFLGAAPESAAADDDELGSDRPARQRPAYVIEQVATWARRPDLDPELSRARLQELNGQAPQGTRVAMTARTGPGLRCRKGTGSVPAAGPRVKTAGRAPSAATPPVYFPGPARGNIPGIPGYLKILPLGSSLPVRDRRSGVKSHYRYRENSLTWPFSVNRTRCARRKYLHGLPRAQQCILFKVGDPLLQ